MIKLTKTELQNLFDGNQTWEQMSERFTTEAGIEITPKMVQEMFKANGFNLRTRKQPKTAWFTVVDDTTPQPNSWDNTEVLTEELTEELA